MNFLNITYNIMMYFLAIVSIVVIVFIVVVLPIIIITHYTPKKKWYRIAYKFDINNYYYVVKAKNHQQAEIKFRTKSSFGGYPIVSIEEIKIIED
jgi:hypothetical protein